MRFFDYISMALRNIWRQKLRSTLTIFAVVIGATSVSIMLALVTGARSFFKEQVEANGTLQQIAISPQTDLSNFSDAGHGGNNCDSCVKLTDNLADKIKAIPHVVGVSRQLMAGGFEALIYNGKKFTLNGIIGYDANGIVSNTMRAGRDIGPKDSAGVITISSDYADALGFKNNYQNLIGKQVQILTQDWYSGIGATIQMPPQCNGPCNNTGPPKQQPTSLNATVVGISDSSNNSRTIRAPLSWVRGMNEQQMYQVTPADQAAQQTTCRNVRGPCNPTPQMTLVITDFIAQNGYSEFIAKVDQVGNAKAVVASIKRMGVGAADAQSMINAQLAVFNIVGLVLGGIGGIALMVAAIGVVNTMVMAILERTREIGVMRAIGAKRSTISRLFTFEASLLGFWGGVTGIAVGYGLTRIANVLINKQLASNSIKAHNIVNLPLWLIVAVIIATTVIGLLAGLYPAHRAAKLDPVESLHYE